MNSLAWLAIWSALSQAPADGRYPDAVEVYHETFDVVAAGPMSPTAPEAPKPDADLDFDGWPDAWKRVAAPGFPRYVKIGLVPASEDASRSSNRALKIELDGAGGWAVGPEIPITSGHDYVLEALVRVNDVVHDEARLLVNFLDEDHHLLQTIEGPPIGATNGWKKARIGPLTCDSDRGQYVTIGLRLAPAGKPSDLVGAAAFDDLWFARVPRLSLEISPSRQLYDLKQVQQDGVRAVCQTSGETFAASSVVFELEDALGQRIAQETLPFRPTEEGTHRKSAAEAREARVVISATEWRLPITTPGFYRLRANMQGSSGPVQTRETTLAVAVASPGPKRGEFGWTLERGEGPLSLPELAQLAGEVGIHWIKFPLWYEDKDRDRVDKLMWFTDRVDSQGIVMVGVLSEPPENVRKNLGIKSAVSAASMFTQAPKLWYPPQETVMGRLSLRVRWWQLGRDKDTSFVGYPGLETKLHDIKGHLDGIGQDVNLGLGWGWLDEEPNAAKPAWRFLSRTSDPPLAPDEMEAYLSPKRPGVAQWVSIEPLDPAKYTIETRTSDLVRRMVAAKAAGADAIFFSEPFATGRGLLNDDGTAGELLLPWRETARRLAGATSLGRIDMPLGSENEVFSRRGEAVMVVWSSPPRRETLYLGENLTITDCWGRETKPKPNDKGAHEIETREIPVFISGVNEPIARWRQEFRFGKETMPGEFGVPHANSLHVKNHYPQGVSVKIKIQAPQGWDVNPKTFELKLGANEELDVPFTIKFPPGVSSGEHPIVTEFDLAADRNYSFNVYRRLTVGLDDVRMEATSRVTESGELEVEQRIVNRTESALNFRCFISIPGKRRMRWQALDVGYGETFKTYRVSGGAALVGQSIKIRAEEIAGPRVLSYELIVQE